MIGCIIGGKAYERMHVWPGGTANMVPWFLGPAQATYEKPFTESFIQFSG